MSAGNPFGCYDRRFVKELLPVLIGAVVVVGLKLALPRSIPTWPIHAMLALIMAYAIVISVAAIRRLDELEQRIQLIAIAVSFTLTGILVTTADILEKDGFPRIGGSWLWLIMAAIWFVSALVLRRRYR